MTLSGKKVFVAGATGMAGTGILKRLAEKHPDTQVIAGSNQSRPIISAPNIEHVSGDLLNLDDCLRQLNGCDMAVMAAALTGGGGLAQREPARYVQDNLFMNMRFLEACRISGVKRVVWIGSATLYQDHEGAITEDGLDLNQDPPEPHDGFGWCCRYMEQMYRHWHRRFGLEAILVRSANIYGPRAPFDPQRSNFIPSLIRKAVDRLDPFEVWGSPDVTRDVIFVDDFAAAVVGLLAETDVKMDVFNVGMGEVVTVGQVVRYALDAAGHRPSQIMYQSDRPAAVKVRNLDCSKLMRVLGWRPDHDVRLGIEITTGWWRENKAGWTR